jgi:PPOX class probable F420-dependent enzyme
MSSKSTATPENALTPEEIDTRLGSTAGAHLATFRADGMIHLTPIWFVWDGSVFRLSLGAGRVHLKNLAVDPRVTILVDEDPRLQQGLAAGAWAIECRGTAELSNDETLIREVTHRALVKALGMADAELYTGPLMAEGRTVVTITPETWHTWDYNKVD